MFRSIANSEIAITDAAKVATSGNLEFEIDPVDSTGMALLDASGVAYFAVLTHPSSRRRLQNTTTPCKVWYDSTGIKNRHLGLCVLPELLTGTFTLEVTDIKTDIVGVLPVNVLE